MGALVACTVATVLLIVLLHHDQKRKRWITEQDEAEVRLLAMRAAMEQPSAEPDPAGDLFADPWPTLDAEPPVVFDRRRRAA